MKWQSFWLIPAFLASTAAVHAQQDRSIAFSDDGRPRTVRVDILEGTLNVRGHAGKDVLLSSSASEREALRIIESNNTISINGMNRGMMVLQVPQDTSLVIRCANCREALVENIRGELDINLLNGAIRLMNVSGSILAHSLNKNIYAVVGQLDRDKPSSFTSMNGSIDCTFPADLKADVKLRTENGRIHTDFDIQLAGGLPIRTDRGIAGKIGGGGPDLQLRAFNGSITIRKK
jgi:hypothetical protein